MNLSFSLFTGKWLTLAYSAMKPHAFGLSVISSLLPLFRALLGFELGVLPSKPLIVFHTSVGLVLKFKFETKFSHLAFFALVISDFRSYSRFSHIWFSRSQRCACFLASFRNRTKRSRSLFHQGFTYVLQPLGIASLDAF